MSLSSRKTGTQYPDVQERLGFLRPLLLEVLEPSPSQASVSLWCWLRADALWDRPVAAVAHFVAFL